MVRGDLRQSLLACLLSCSGCADPFWDAFELLDAPADIAWMSRLSVRSLTDPIDEDNLTESDGILMPPIRVPTFGAQQNIVLGFSSEQIQSLLPPSYELLSQSPLTLHEEAEQGWLPEPRWVASVAKDGTLKEETEIRLPRFTTAWLGAPVLVWLPIVDFDANPYGSSTPGMTYDRRREEIVLFGGGRGALVSLTDQTWEYNGEIWQLVQTATAPAARHAHAMAYDEAHDRVVLFGGYDKSANYRDDTWIYNGTSWTPLHTSTAPSPRTRHTMVYDQAREKVVLYGGWDGRQTMGDTWELDGSSWQPIQPTQSPPALGNHTMVYDQRREKVVLFGGKTANEALSNDTWEYDGITWSLVETSTAPPKRRSAAMAYHEALDTSILFGGLGEHGRLADTWKLEKGQWSRMAHATAPTARSEHVMSYHAAHDRTVLFGGYDAEFRNDTWELVPY